MKLFILAVTIGVLIYVFSIILEKDGIDPSAWSSDEEDGPHW